MSINPQRQLGITLIEQIMFILIISVGVIGLVAVMNPAIKASANPILTKQFVAIAESLLNEIEHQPFTWCDLDDTNASTAQSYAGCASNPQNVSSATPSTETRNGSGGTGEFFDNVRDYGGYVTESIADPAGGSAITGYRAEVGIVEAGATFSLTSDAVVAITVTVCRAVTPTASCAGRDSFALTGYRFRYAPRY